MNQRASRLPGQPSTNALGGLALQLGAGAAQTLEGFAGGITQPRTGIGEFYAAPFLDEQANAKLLFELLDLPTDRAVGHVQLARRFAQTAQPGGSLEGSQCVERR